MRRMEMFKLKTRSARETKKIAGILAKELMKVPLKNKAMVVALSGDLGGGKTTFTQGFAKGFGIRENVLSPTFLILKTYKIPTSSGPGYKFFTHIDAYRLEEPKEILNLGWKELVGNPRRIIVIEWARRIKRILPKIYLDIRFDFISPNIRRLNFYVRGR